MTADPFVILYVEDNEFIRESFIELLASAERRIVGAADSAAARSALRDLPVNLLITDLNLPDGSGLDVAREALSRNPALPVILCSGENMAHVARSLGPAVHSLMKPFEVEDLEALIDRIAG